ncbi:molybdopterin dinucleotide binding domain-containing protein [Chloroflexota bacterium]
MFKNYGYDPLPTYKEPELQPSQKYPLTLICAKVLQFCHGQHRSLPSLRKVVPYPFLEINTTKAREMGIQQGDWLMLESPSGSMKVKARLTTKIAPDVVCTQHGWWQSCPELNLPGFDPYSPEGANVNLLYSNEPADPLSGSLLYKGYPCNFRKP